MTGMTASGRESVLRVGARFKMDVTGDGGIVGLLAADATGRVCGVTSRHTLGSAGPRTVRGDDGRELSERVHVKAVDPRPRPVAEAVGYFEASPEVFVTTSEHDYTSVLAAADIEHLIGTEVHKIDWRGRQQARVSRLHGSLRLVPRYGEAAKLYDVVEISPRNPAAFPVSGDSGALVTTTDNVPIGVLLAGQRDRYFLAPVSPFLAAAGLRVVTEEDVINHNASALSARFEPGRIERRIAPFVNSLYNRTIRISYAERANLDQIVLSFPGRPETETRMSPLTRALTTS